MPAFPDAETPEPDLRHPLAYQDVVLFLVARFAGVIGSAMQAVAVGWQVYDLTHDPLDLGFVGLAQFIPGLVLCLATGHVADRYDRRLVTLCCYGLQTAAAAALLLMALTHTATEAGILAAVFAFGTARAFERPATAAMLPNLLPAAVFPRAVAWSSSAGQTGVVLGPALGGLLYAVSPSVVFGAETLALAAALTGILAIRARSVRVVRETGLQAIVAGLAFIVRRPVILGAVSLDLFAVLLGGATALLPVFGRDILHVGPEAVGLLRGAPALGSVATALLLAQLPMRRRAGRRMFIAVAIFGLATLVFALSRSFPLSLVTLVVLGAADAVSVQVRATLVQIATPDEMRGRVSAVNYLFVGTSNELGEFESGVTAAWLGPVGSVVLGGLGTLAVVAIWAWRFPELRRYENLERYEPAAAPERATDGKSVLT